MSSTSLIFTAYVPLLPMNKDGRIVILIKGAF